MPWTRNDGDIDDLTETRRQTGPDTVTRGDINCELMYDLDLVALRSQTQHLLDPLEGYKHIMGDINPSCPSYPWERIQTVIDVVSESGRLFE